MISTRKTQISPFWAIVVGYICLLAFIMSPLNAKIPTTILSFVVFLIIQLFCPKCRLSFKRPLTPANLAQSFFALQLLVIPFLLLVYGIELGPLPTLPSNLAINLGLIITICSYLVFAGSYKYFGDKKPQDYREELLDVWYPTKHMAFLALAYLALGFLGFFLFAGSFGQYIKYLSSPSYRFYIEELVSGKLSGALSTFLRPFLGFSIVLVWSLWIDKHRFTKNTLVISVATILCIILLITVNLGFYYNRGAIVGPILAVGAAYHLRIRRIPLAILGSLGGLLFLILLIFAPYRQTDLVITDLAKREQLKTLLNSSDTVREIQLYGGAPQFVGYLVEESGWGLQPYWGKTLFASLLYPIPVLGKQFRERSGVILYNTYIYNDPRATDQVVPFSGELFINFHIIGLIIGFGLVGLLVANLQRVFNKSRNTFEAYCTFLVAIWVAFLVPGSIAVTSQIFVFAFWPIYVYVALCWLRRVSGKKRLMKIWPTRYVKTT